MQPLSINVPSQETPITQAAIGIAGNGDEIIIVPGTYFEAIDLNGKTLTICRSASLTPASLALLVR